jgi:predicted 3-demethylubiquinone-9 3-methyltransferase (glyoxalase superfamily)
VEFELFGHQFAALNGEPAFSHNEAVSFQERSTRSMRSRTICIASP